MSNCHICFTVVVYYGRYAARFRLIIGGFMDTRDELIALRKSTEMNRKEFCIYFGIPYRTVTDWELGNRKMPEYLLRLMAYKIESENLNKRVNA